MSNRWQILDLPDLEKQFYTAAIPLLFCLLFIFACYVRSIMIINGYPEELQESMKKTIKKLLLYPLVQIIAIAPAMIFVSLNVLSDVELPAELTLLIGIPLGLVGLVNAIIFFVQQKSSMGLQASAVVLEEMNNSFSNCDDSFETVDYKYF